VIATLVENCKSSGIEGRCAQHPRAGLSRNASDAAFLCSYAVAGHALLKSVCNDDGRRVVALSVHFSAPVFPGATIRTKIWVEKDPALQRNVEIIVTAVLQFADGPA
jgi:hypothetical protein